MPSLSLSVRIVESRCKTRLNFPFEEFVVVASETGYAAICMRASAGGIGTPPARLDQMRRCVEGCGLRVSMVTADFDVPLNNDDGPNSLRNIGPSLDVAEALGCNLIRVCLKRRDDIPFARSAADAAAARGIRLAHQCHTATLFEQVESMLQVLTEIDRPNFGLIYEPANLLLCGQSYGRDTLQKLRPHLMNVYVQNHRLDPRGPDALSTYCRGEVRFQHLAPWDAGGVDFGTVLSGLKQIGYQGAVTIHQAQGIETVAAAREFAAACSRFFNSIPSGGRLADRPSSTVLETDRLVLRHWSVDDTEPFSRICADPEVMRFVGTGEPWSRERTETFIADAIRMQQQHGYCRWAMVARDTGLLLGFCGFVPTDGGAEIGWRLARDSWGQGLATEAARAALTHGLVRLGFAQVTATVQSANPASQRVAEKLRMTLVKTFLRNGREILEFAVTHPASS